MKNGYPEKVVYRILYEVVKTTKQHQQGDKATDSANVFYVPNDSRAKKIVQYFAGTIWDNNNLQEDSNFGELNQEEEKTERKKSNLLRPLSIKCPARNVTRHISGNQRIQLLRGWDSTRHYAEGK